MSDITDLQETTPNHWRAKYHGNYGIYTVKIEFDGEKMKNFSCSCPSDYYPCKHIPIVRNAIGLRIATTHKNQGSGIFEETVRKVPIKDLQDFIIRHGMHNPTFQQALLLAFPPQHTASEKNSLSEDNNYSEIIRNALNDFEIDHDGYMYDLYDLEIDVLDDWLGKAYNYLEEGNNQEAILIAKACIEEYAEWADSCGYDLDFLELDNYTSDPFDLLYDAYYNAQIPMQELLDYCKEEVKKKKYKNACMIGSFEELIKDLTEETNPKAFIETLDKDFKNLKDKSSYEAKSILERKIGFYKNHGEIATAQKIIEENLQIESFREEVVKKRIADKQYTEAKKLVNEFLSTKEKGGLRMPNFNTHWNEYLLEIAKKEKDTNEIRNISQKFLENKFQNNYLKIFQSTFSNEEWPSEVDKLIKTYQKEAKSWFSTNIANLLVAEKRTEELLEYLTKTTSIDRLEEYYKHIAPEFPEKTLALFKQAMDKFILATGRDIYEKTIQYFKAMLNIKGGKQMVEELMADYKIRYRSRRAMIEIFEKFEKKVLSKKA